ncbi:MAG TPA: hypothetical protein VG963_20065 [Polyangiaceae bacterium]|nr:hypothetical protein [Polyangiaceae bacterium]
MLTDPRIIIVFIGTYKSLLRADIDPAARSMIERMLIEAHAELFMATAKRSEGPSHS